MVIKAKVIGRFNSEETSFARLVLKGNPWRKNSPMFRFFDIVDDGELSIGDKIEISVTRVIEIDMTRIEQKVFDGCKFHSAV